MAKNVIKEIIIVLLLALAIILIHGVLLYEYVPANKIIPERVSYTTSENVKEELQTDESAETTELDITYHIDTTDLNNYKKTQDYVPGKKNPFSSTTTGTTTDGNTNTGTTGTNSNTNTNTSGGTQGSGTSGNTSTTTDDNTNSGYLPDKGTK